jgi:hypothetical protein
MPVEIAIKAPNSFRSSSLGNVSFPKKSSWYAGHPFVILNHRATSLSRATFLAQRQGIDLAILSQGDPLLMNRYSVIVVNPDKHPLVHQQTARKFAEFLLSPEVRKVIASFGTDRYGHPLFFVGAPGKEKVQDGSQSRWIGVPWTRANLGTSRFGLYLPAVAGGFRR